MKKLLFFIASTLVTMTTNAKELGNSLNLPEFNSGKMVWLIRAGVGFHSVVGEAKEEQSESWKEGNWDGSFKSAPGYVVSFGFNKSFGLCPLYWGMSVDLGMRGYKTNAEWLKSNNNSFGGYDWHKRTYEQTLSTFNVQFSPITIGYRHIFLKRMAADIHVEAYASYDFAGNFKTYNTDHIISTSKYGNRNDFEEYETKAKISDMDAMRKYDVGMKIGIGYWFGHFNIDFTWQRGFIPLYDEDDHLFSNNFQIRLGYAF